MFRFPDKPKKHYIECLGPGPHVTKSGSRWLVDGLHKYVQIEDGTFRCQKCVEGAMPKLKPLPPDVQAHEIIARTWGIKRGRQRTDKYPGSDMWNCTHCGRRGDFWFFKFTVCPRQSDTKEEVRQELRTGFADIRETFEEMESGTSTNLDE